MISLPLCGTSALAAASDAAALETKATANGNEQSKKW